MCNAASSCNGIKLKLSAKLRPKCHSFRILVGETSVPQTELYSNYPLQILWLSEREWGKEEKVSVIQLILKDLPNLVWGFGPLPEAKHQGPI